jgi:hypothetical protein
MTAKPTSASQTTPKQAMPIGTERSAAETTITMSKHTSVALGCRKALEGCKVTGSKAGPSYEE